MTDPASIFCPAATGLSTVPERACPREGDGAHRCRRTADHPFRRPSPIPLDPPLPDGVTRFDHACICGFGWSSGLTVDEQARALAEAAARGREEGRRS